MVDFKEARDIVEAQLGPTLAEGYEDVSHFNVLLREQEADDQVTLVNKATGAVERQVYFEVEERLAQMRPVE